MMNSTNNNVCRNVSKGFTFIWKIANFRYKVLRKGDSFCSPKFKLGNLTGNWNISLCLGGSSDSLVECKLKRSSDESSYNLKLMFCVCCVNGEVLLENVKENLLYNEYCEDEHSIIQFERKILEALPEDTLVMHCHLQDYISGIQNLMQSFATTCMNLERRIFHWKVDQFSSLPLRKDTVFNLSEIEEYGSSSVSLSLFLHGRNLEDASVQVSINFKHVQSGTFSTCTIFLIDRNGAAKKHMHIECLLVYGNNFIQFPHCLTRREILTDYLENDTLVLRGEVTMSKEVNSQIHQATYGLIAIEPETEAIRASSSLEHVSPALSADLLALYEGSSGPPSDFELRVGGRSFPVHQTILGSRSNVFRAMFDNDMLEQSTKSAELTDLDADTAERLLKFAYADVEPPPGLSCEELTSLYSAADKYEILALRKICARRLVQALSAANAPKILQFADLHRDSSLKESVMEFISHRGQAVLKSDQWKTLQQNDPNLVTETLQKILCEKFCFKY